MDLEVNDAKQALMEKKIHKEGRVIAAARKENGIDEGTISDLDMFVSASGSSDSVDSSILSDDDLVLEGNPNLPGYFFQRQAYYLLLAGSPRMRLCRVVVISALGVLAMSIVV